MSTILPGPALGKRKSIDPCQYDHSSDKHEAILGEKKDATVGEALLVDKEEPILGEKKDATLGEKEKKEDDRVDYSGLRKLMKELTAKLIQEMEESGEKLELGPPRKCRICSSYHYSCPWQMGSYAEELEDLPKVSSRYWLVCYRCGCTEFEKKHPNDRITCKACVCAKICAVRKKCPWCLCYGHVNNKDEDCVFSKKEWTLDNDPLFRNFEG